MPGVPGLLADGIESFPAILHSPPGDRRGTEVAYARALDLELVPPQPSIARSLRLLPGQAAISVTVRFDDHVTGMPVGLTAVTLKPDRFRVVIQAGDALPRSPHPPDLCSRISRIRAHVARWMVPVGTGNKPQHPDVSVFRAFSGRLLLSIRCR